MSSEGFFPSHSSHATPMTLDLKITGGEVFDGLGNPPQRADVGVRGERIAEIDDLSRAPAAQEIRADGRYVCPGFIDVHTHSDAYILIEPDARSKVFQGVTTEVVGNCGTSATPLMGEYRMPADWRAHTYPGAWNRVADYRDRVEEVGPAVNVAMLVGHNTLRAGVMGYEGRPATDEEMRRMCAQLDACLEEGARGFSTGLIYIPGAFAPREEIAELARIVARHDGLYASHMRSESDALVEAIDEILDCARRAGCRTQISHLKTSGRQNWHKLDAVLEKFRAARAEGLDIAADRYPYTAACTDLDILLPDWALDGGHAAILGRMRDPDTRSRIRAELLETRPADYWTTVHVGSARHPDNTRFMGRPIPEVAGALGVDPVDAVLHVIDTEELHATGIFFGMSEDNLWRILAEPYVMLGSDGSIHAPDGPLSHDHPHPRAYGTFPRYVRAVLDGRSVPLTEAIRKMTSLPAERLRLKGRGVLQPGSIADVTVLDPATIRDTSTYAEPHQLARGIDALVVNGVLTLHEGRLTGCRGGRFLG